jgi:hypothetical protein
MDVKRHDHKWLVRWMTSAGTESALFRDAPPGDLCAHCDDRGAWTTVSDMRPMPEANFVHMCWRCGTTTAHAELRVTARSIGD